MVMVKKATKQVAFLICISFLILSIESLGSHYTMTHECMKDQQRRNVDPGFEQVRDMERIYGIEAVLLKHGPNVDRRALEEWIAKIQRQDPDVFVMRYPASTDIAHITKDETWLVVDDLIRWLESCESQG